MKNKDNILDAVLVGCGNISRIWMEAINKIPELRLVGLVDQLKQRADELTNEFGLDLSTHHDLNSLLRDKQPNVVFDCTPPKSRVKIAEIAFKAGCHLLTEKPLSSSKDDSKWMIALANQYQRVGATMQNHRYDAHLRELKAFLSSGEIGQIVQCSSQFFVYSHFSDFRVQMPHVLLMDMGIHTFDAARALLSENPISVYCHEWNPQGSRFAHDAAAVAVFEFPSGITYTYQGNWSAHGLRTSWNSEWRIVGTHGSVYWDGANTLKVQKLVDINNIDLGVVECSVPFNAAHQHQSGHLRAIKRFIQDIIKEEEPETSFKNNFPSLSMVLSCIESAQSKSPVKIES